MAYSLVSLIGLTKDWTFFCRQANIWSQFNKFAKVNWHRPMPSGRKPLFGFRQSFLFCVLTWTRLAFLSDTSLNKTTDRLAHSLLSRFCLLNAQPSKSQHLEVSKNVCFGPGRLLLTTNLVLGFTRKIHSGVGNIVLGDGSVQQVSNGRLRET